MTKTIDSPREYLEALRRELAGSDKALLHDALYDAEDHLRAIQDDSGSDADEKLLAERLLEEYGDPAEVAAAYRETDARVSQAFASPPIRTGPSPLERFLGVLVDPHAYGALIFVLLSLVTGILYFTWAMVGFSLSAGLAILIIGVPFTVFFLGSVRIFALMEGRLVETLLGVRMPRRPARGLPQGTWLERLRVLASDGRTWAGFFYMILKLPLGILSFTVAIFLLSLSLALLLLPFAQSILDIPLLTIWNARYFVPAWLFPIFWLASAFDLLVLLHVSKALARFQARAARAMLVPR